LCRGAGDGGGGGAAAEQRGSARSKPQRSPGLTATAAESAASREQHPSASSPALLLLPPPKSGASKRHRGRDHGGGGAGAGQLREGEEVVLQQYVLPPMLIGRRKFDLRCFCMVASVEPALVLRHETFYLRRSCEIFDTKDLSKRTPHLTNISLQKHHPRFGEDCVWDGPQFGAFLAQRGAVRLETILSEVDALMTKCLKAALPLLARDRGCFQLLGFDLLLNQKVFLFCCTPPPSPPPPPRVPLRFAIPCCIPPIPRHPSPQPRSRLLVPPPPHTLGAAASYEQGCRQGEVSLLEINRNPDLQPHTRTLHRILPPLVDDTLQVATQVNVRLRGGATAQELWPLHPATGYKLLFSQGAP